MAKLGRAERVAYIVKTLVERPGELIPLSYFAQRLGVGKSSISEDLAAVKAALEAAGSGILRTVPGAAGGVAYWPLPSPAEQEEVLERLCQLLSAPERILPGGFIFMTDLISSPAWTARIGEIFAAHFRSQRPTCVLTVETKGIPLALMTARALNVPMVVARREGRVTEGPQVTISYVTGSRGRIETLTVGIRSIPRAARVLIIDDFIKAGGTARGLVDLVRQFEGAEVVGIGVLIQTAQPERKRVEGYLSLLTLEEVDEERGRVQIRPSLPVVKE
ncbi:MAG: pur operon repressor [Bacillota bacterium]|nr:MAG: pur operon repressor [Bacillota bacterium]